jgi:hypothetical protein
MEEVVVTPQISKYRNKTFIEHSLWRRRQTNLTCIWGSGLFGMFKIKLNSFVPSKEEEEEEEEPLSNGGHS